VREGTETNQILASAGARGHGAGVASHQAPGDQAAHRLHGCGHRSNEEARGVVAEVGSPSCVDLRGEWVGALRMWPAGQF
jgi:hypothetical protein